MSTEDKSRTSEIIALGKKMLDEVLTPELLAQHHWEAVVIDVDTGEFAFDKNVLVARRSLKSPPGSRLYATRVGDLGLFRIGYTGPPH